jgi:N-glycosylase/DNA lyase
MAFNNKLESSRMKDGKVFEKVTAHEYRILSRNAREYFGKYCGYAQQYLFYNIRQNAGKKW